MRYIFLDIGKIMYNLNRLNDKFDVLYLPYTFLSSKYNDTNLKVLAENNEKIYIDNYPIPQFKQIIYNYDIHNLSNY